MKQNNNKTETRFTTFDPSKISREKILEIAREMEPAGKDFLKGTREIMNKYNHKNPVETSEAIIGVLLGVIDTIVGGEDTTGVLITMLYKSFMVDKSKKGLGNMSEEEMVKFIKSKEKENLGKKSETPSYFG